MRNGTAALHHSISGLRPGLRTASRGGARVAAAPHASSRWRVARLIALGLARRPLLALTLAVAAVFLFAAAGETLAAQRLDAAAIQVQHHNTILQEQITQIDARIAHQQDRVTIINAARNLGWDFPHP